MDILEATKSSFTMKAMVEYLMRGLVISQKVVSMLQGKLARGDKKTLVEELVTLKVDHGKSA
ncbi:hypothetical protein DEO72_LG10g1742 [Vigna unguiculata]|uniref:Uncharacterized protein n=1 Tax=Vigna unguiculata TaxID=3917 RepID=A0A4D6NC82_VIGUN|nr:hypothetical protein DEO72_LG10g1742 [Vigna unguiculata]